MKTAIVLSCLLAGSSVYLKNHGISFHDKAVKDSHTTTRATSTLPISPVYIVVDKSSYELYVYDAKGWYATYPVVFGNNSLDDKKMEGDRNTPEGNFRIANKRVHEKWNRYMGLDYPTPESIARFNERKRRGEIPASAKPGAGIGIHGVYPHEDFVIDRYKNWTNGCISLKNSDVTELYSYIPVGTQVIIRK